jgi:hypothetical protein
MFKMLDGKVCKTYSDCLTLVNNEALAEAQDACDTMIVSLSDIREAQRALKVDKNNNHRLQELKKSLKDFFRANNHAIKHVTKALRVLCTIYATGEVMKAVKDREQKRRKKHHGT